MDKQTIKSWFTRGKKPTQAQFWTVFDSYRHIDDRLTMSDIEGLMMALATKSNEGHTHTLAEITDYQSQEKEVINSRVAANQDELDEMDLVDGMKYILLSDEKLYVCTYNEDTEELELNEDTPSPDVIYSAEDAAHDMKIYLYNAATLLFQDVTGQEVDKTIYTPDLDSLITRQLNNGIYSVVHINSGDDNNTYGDAYTLTVGDGSIACRILECRTGWAQAQLVDDSYQWKWHRYSYEGHTHEMNTISGLIEALAGKAAVAHNHVLTDITGLADALAGKAAAVHTHAMSAITGLADALSAKANTIHQHDMAQVTGLSTALAGKQSTSDNSLLTTSKNIVGAINELFSSLSSMSSLCSVRAYTLDFGTGGELIQDVNTLGSITINRIVTRNVAHLYITYGNVSHQEINLSQSVNITIPDAETISWEIVRSIDDGLAAVGVRCSINQ